MSIHPAYEHAAAFSDLTANACDLINRIERARKSADGDFNAPDDTIGEALYHLDEAVRALRAARAEMIDAAKGGDL